VPELPNPTQHVDAIIVGAGPVGLFQVFQLGLQGIHVHIIDALPAPGGQCIALYPDKPIYDIPAVPVCTGRELVARLLEQIRPFAPSLHLGQLVTEVAPQADQSVHVRTSAGLSFVTQTLFIAGGVGAFLPRALALPGIQALSSTQLHTAPNLPPPGQHILILGHNETALQHAIALHQHGGCASISVIHRRDQFDASAATLQAFAALRQNHHVSFIAAQATGFEHINHRLTALTVATPDGQIQTLPADTLYTFLGLSPKLGPIADWGLNLEHKQIPVDPTTFQTQTPRLYAVGDINTYSHKKKLILCGFHEATLAAHYAAAQLRPESAGPLQYTTTSKKLQQLLGIIPGA
jgi:thioredoxin reductase (NADPH)